MFVLALSSIQALSHGCNFQLGKSDQRMIASPRLQLSILIISMGTMKQSFNPFIFCFFSSLFFSTLTLEYAHGQGLCEGNNRGVFSSTGVLGCLGKNKYNIPHGFEIFGISQAGRRSFAANSPTLRVRTGENVTLNTGNTAYRDFFIEAGATLSVPSGTVIRVTGGSCDIAGTLSVLTSAGGGKRPDVSTGFGIDRGSSPAHAGISRRSAGFGDISQSVDTVIGGSGGLGLESSQAMQIRYPGLFGGGGGAPGLVETGGAGGGSFVLLCERQISVTGTVLSNGFSALGAGGGGGAGGVVVFGSENRIVTTASSLISAQGGDGGPAAANSAPGGGGGGGIVYLVSPNISTSGSISVLGGSGQSAGSGVVQNQIRSGGGGGGACGGNGGDGGNINSDLSHSVSSAGSAGHSIESRVSPRFIFG